MNALALMLVELMLNVLTLGAHTNAPVQKDTKGMEHYFVKVITLFIKFFVE